MQQVFIRLPKEVDLTALLRDSVISLSTLLSVFVTIHLVYHSYRSYLIKEVLVRLSMYLRVLYTKLFIVALIIYSFLHRPTILQSNPSSGSSPPNSSIPTSMSVNNKSPGCHPNPVPNEDPPMSITPFSPGSQRVRALASVALFLFMSKLHHHSHFSCNSALPSTPTQTGN